MLRSLRRRPSRTFRHRAALLLLSGFGGCSLDESAHKNRCVDDDDCLSGRVCDDGVCRARSSGSSGTNSGGDSGAGSSGGTCGGSCGGTHAGAGHGGEPDGGTSGTNATGGTDSGNGGGGTAGHSAGAGPTEPGERCNENDATACSVARPELVLQCSGGVWTTAMRCNPQDRCEPSMRRCAPVHEQCVGNIPGICLGEGALLDCATNPFDPIQRYCPFGCANGACLPGSGDELIVHTEIYDVETRHWPHAVRVCFANGSDDALRRLTRSAVEQGWLRYVDLDFTGWDDCGADDAAGVVVEFQRGCRGRIAGTVRRTSMASQYEVEICASYFDPSETEHELGANAELAQFVARHQFGHVLGLGEGSLDAHSTAMSRTVRPEAVDLTVWSADIAVIRDYGYKPEGAIVHVSGWCLSTDGTAVGLAPCTDTPNQIFRALPDRIENDDGRCLVVNGHPESPAVELGDCPTNPPPNALALRHAQWNAPGHCIAPREVPVVAGTVLEPTSCATFGDPTQTWSFETTTDAGTPTQARIRLAGTNYCLQSPAVFFGRGTSTTSVDMPTLEPCTAASSQFMLGPKGDVSVLVPGTQDRRCLDWMAPASVLNFRQCNDRPFVLTGPLETADGLTLASTPDDPADGLSIVARGPGESPVPGQVFDVHF